jgi:hypothetical protein
MTGVTTHPTRTRAPERHRRPPLGAALAGLALMAVACGGESPTTQPVTATTACPFSGATTPTSSGPPVAGAAVLSGITTRQDGCIDNIQFDFSPAAPGWSIAYSPAVPSDLTPLSAVPDGSQLVIRFTGTTAAPGYSGGAVPVKALGDVTQVTQAGAADGSLAFVITVATEQPYVVSTSNVPANVVVGLG